MIFRIIDEFSQDLAVSLDTKFLTWNNHESRKTWQTETISLPEYCESNQIPILLRYQDELKDLANSRVGNQSLQEYLCARDFDLWNSCIIVENNWTKSSWVFDAIKLVAIILLIESLNPDTIEIDIRSNRLSRSIEVICNNRQVNFRMIRKSNRYSLGNLHAEFLLAFFRGLFYQIYNVYLAVQFKTFFHRKSALSDIPSCAVITYTENTEDFANKGYSRYLGHLPRVGQSIRHRPSYFFLHSTGTSLFPSLRETKVLKNLVNNSSSILPCIAIAEYSTLRTILTTHTEWLHSLISFNRIWSYLDRANLHSQHFLIPLITRDLCESIWGAHAVRARNYDSVFKNMTVANQKTKNWIFLFEGQDWERIFCQIAQKNTECASFGYVHVNIKKWDMRPVNFSYRNFSFAVSNSYDKHEIMNRNSSSNQIIHLEPLRAPAIPIPPSARFSSGNRLLILGSIDLHMSLDYIKRILKSKDSNSPEITVDIGWHPAISKPRFVRVIQKQLNSLNTNFIERLIAADFIVCVNGTTPINAVLMGKPTCIIAEANELSLTPEPISKLLSTVYNPDDVFMWIDKMKMDSIGPTDMTLLINSMGLTQQPLIEWLKLFDISDF